MRTAITEKNVGEIEVAASSTFNRSYVPVNGIAKWFRDELDQVWVKFLINRRRDAISGKWLAEEKVIPAHLVRVVTYNEKEVG